MTTLKKHVCKSNVCKSSLYIQPFVMCTTFHADEARLGNPFSEMSPFEKLLGAAQHIKQQN